MVSFWVESAPTVVAGILLAVAFARAAYLAVSGRRLREPWKQLSRPTRIGLVLAGLVLLIPRIHVDRYSDFATPFDLLILGFRLDELILLALIGLLVLWLRDEVDESESGWGRAVVWVAVVMLLAAAFPPTARFLYLPVPMAAGLAALLLVMRPERLGGVVSAQPPLDRRSDVLRELVEIRRAARILPTLRRKMLDKVASGDMTHSAHRAKLAEHELAIAEMRERSSRLLQPAETLDDVALGYAPEKTAWDSGKVFAVWALGLALPWIVSSFATCSAIPSDRRASLRSS